MEAEFCSRTFSSSREESGDEELSVLPRHTKVIVTGNNRTKSVLVGLQGVVKKAVGLGGWHWLVKKQFSTLIAFYVISSLSDCRCLCTLFTLSSLSAWNKNIRLG